MEIRRVNYKNREVDMFDKSKEKEKGVEISFQINDRNEPCMTILCD